MINPVHDAICNRMSTVLAHTDLFSRTYTRRWNHRTIYIM